MDKSIILFLFLTFLNGCGTAVKHLDSTLADEQDVVYEKSQPLPPLEVTPELKR